MNPRLDKNHRYIPLSSSEQLAKARKIKLLLDELVKTVSSCKNVSCRSHILLDVIERVEKRRTYFHIFHGITLSEQNEVSLYCFWILKLAPFFDKKVPSHQVNIIFATFLFMKMIIRVGKKIQRPVVFTPTYTQNLVYAFLYRDVSKESIMLIADTFLT